MHIKQPRTASKEEARVEMAGINLAKQKITCKNCTEVSIIIVITFILIVVLSAETHTVENVYRVTGYWVNLDLG